MQTRESDFYNKHSTELKGVCISVDLRNKRLKISDSGIIEENIPHELIKLAERKGLGKIIVNCREYNVNVFKRAGFEVRGIIKSYFRGEDAYFLSFFTDKSRALSTSKNIEDSIIQKCLEKDACFKLKKQASYLIRNAVEEDIPQIVELFKKVFETYPSPVFNSEYLKATMNTKVLYKVAVDNGRIVSIASADMDMKNLNAEITDCATLPEYRGKGLLSSLIHALEKDLKKKGFILVYSLSRALNTGINMVLKKHGYKYCGRLINNCDICGKFEDMNIWAKIL